MAGDSTSTFPYNCVVLIESPDPSRAGYYLIGSGVVIGPHTILTASHVVYDVSAGVADQNIDLYPAWNAADPALGPGHISTTYKDHFNPITTDSSGDLYQWQSASDYAVIDTSYTFSSWMGVVLNYPGGTVHVTGYPASAGGYQVDQTGTVSADPDYSVLDYGTVSVLPGNSGGPVWIDDGGSDDVAGVVSTTGWACQLTTADWNQIEAWVSADGYSLGTTPSHITPTVAAVSNLSLREGQSVPASSLIASISNPGGDAITANLYADLGGGSGYFTVNGVRQPDGVWFSASPSADVKYVGGASPGSDTLEVGIHDSTTNSNIYASNSVVATTVARGSDPPGTASGILFQNASSGQIAIWDMSGLSIVGGGIVGLDPGPSWQAIGTGDFKDAGHPGILFQSASSGQIAIWEMNGLSVIGGGTLGPDPGPSWQAIGTGDFNDDGHSDILFQNANSGQIAIWDMNGTSIVGGGMVGADPGPTWRAIGASDFNDDGHSDILFQNTSGQIAIWDMNGTTIVGGGFVSADPGPGWQAIGGGDFNHDGHSDILFQNPGNGQIAIWEMKGTNIIGGGVVGADPGPSWHAIGANDGGADILFQNTNGQTAIWDMNGTSIAGGGTVSPNPGSSWRTVGLT
jgi:V8-like Glu-specific endopeptidase